MQNYRIKRQNKIGNTNFQQYFSYLKYRSKYNLSILFNNLRVYIQFIKY